jgi:hypothetical protein
MHRDLKPSNILVDDEGEPHVVDFGLAKPVDKTPCGPESFMMPTLTGELKGTLAYMSPEQVLGKSEWIDMRTDQYSLGIILYQLITRQFPYDVTGSALDTLRVIGETEPALMRKHHTQVDSDLDRIVSKALEKTPARRYDSVAGLSEDLENWLQGRPIRIRSDSTWYVLRTLARKHRYTTSVVGLVCLIVLGFSALSINLYWTARQAQEDRLQLTAEWNAQTNQELEIAKEVSFMLFVQAWQQGRLDQARAAATFFARGSREQKAVSFLMADPAAADQSRIEVFLDDLDPSEQWFGQFVLGQYFDTQGQWAQARTAYQASLDAMHGVKLSVPPWISTQAQNRLTEMSHRSGSEE